MSLRVIKLHFNQAVHFGKRRLGESAITLESDTLFSALFIEALHLKLDTTFLSQELHISDTFPFSHDVLFLPKPMLFVSSDTQDASDKKVFKKLKFVPIHHIHNFIAGKCGTNDVQMMIDLAQFGYFETQTKVALESEEAIQSGNSQPYNVGIFRFFDNMGLYFIASGSEAAMEKLEVCLNSLQYAGLGGKRKAGLGQFTFEFVNHAPLHSLLSKQGTHKILLSTAMVSKDEDLSHVLENASYLLKKRSGFVQSTTYAPQLVKKQDFYSFAAGSVFVTKFKGDIFDVGNNGSHSVFRYAKALWLEVSV